MVIGSKVILEGYYRKNLATEINVLTESLEASLVIHGFILITNIGVM